MKKRYIQLIFMFLHFFLFLGSFSGCSNPSTPSDENNLLGEKNETEEPKREIISYEEKYNNSDQGLLMAPRGTKLHATVDRAPLGFGYNILESKYFNDADVKLNSVMDMDRFVADSLKEDSDPSNSEKKATGIYIKYNAEPEIQTTIATSIKKYSEKTGFHVGINVGYFKGDISTNFSKSHREELTETQRIVTKRAILKKEQYYIADVTPKIIAEYAEESFINHVKTMSAEKLVQTYGTHILTNIYVGGRFDLNFFYDAKDSKKADSISLTVDASYRYVEGSADTEAITAKNEMSKNSTLITRAYGGSVAVSAFSLEDAQTSYKKWSESIEEGKSLSFVDIFKPDEGSSGNDWLIPIWDVVKELGYEDKANEIKTYFNNRSSEISGEMKDTTQSYIKSIQIGYGSSELEAKSMLKSIDGVTIYDENIKQVDLNRNVGGKYIYLGYEVTTDKSKAITGIVADYFDKGKKSDIKYKNLSYTIIPHDLNMGAEGKWIYLYYTKDPKAGTPITDIIYQYEGTDKKIITENNMSTNGYKAIVSASNGKPMDFNKGAGGDFIYLWYKRAQ